MKPTRTIEKLAYGEGTPDELADMVPKWDELDLPRSYRGWDSMGIHGSGLSIRDTRDGRWYMTAPDALSARWFAACLIAHQAGCPPHWVDMGFTPLYNHDQGHYWFGGPYGKRFGYTPGDYEIDEYDLGTGFKWFKGGELEVRQYAYGLIKEVEQ
jgi:hypothetical protein